MKFHKTMILIYKLNKSKLNSESKLEGYTEVWKPKAFKYRHQRLPKKYFMWWVFHYLGIFKSNKIAIYTYYESRKLAHFFCLVPAYYRWPFMSAEDVQVTYVVTEKEFQGKGIAYRFISSVLNSLSGSENVWYVTDKENIASQSLALKIGFELVGKGFHKKYFGGLIKKLILEKN